MIKKKDGFLGERAVILSPMIIEMEENDPLVSSLYITDIGHYPMAEHHHRVRQEAIDQYVLIYCVDGSGWYVLKGQRYEVKRNQYFILPAGTPHEYGATEGERWTIYWVHFRGEHASVYAEGAQKPQEVKAAMNSNISNRNNIFEEILSTLHFGDGVTVEGFISDDLEFVFAEETYKKVPVRPVLSVHFLPQYMATRPMSLQPDTVLVYGEPARLENVEAVATKPLELYDVRGSVHGKIRLETPMGVRLSHEECVYSMEVSRYVEIRAEVKVETRNVPARVDLAVLPSTATAVFRCAFPTASDPSVHTHFYVDYREFANSRSGRCMAHCEGLPSDVIDYTLTPEVFDCMVKTAE